MALVQHSSNTASTGSSLTVTLGANTSPGNCLIVCFSASGWTTLPTVSSVKVGGVADNFASAASMSETNSPASWIYYDQGMTQASESVVVAFSGSTYGLSADVYEWGSVLPTGAKDKTSTGGSPSAGTPWSTGSSGTLSQPLEVAFGVMSYFSETADTLTGPSSPWTNPGQLSVAANGFYGGQMSGYQQVHATTALTYNGTGTVSSNCYYAACIATFKMAASGGTLMAFPF